MIWVTVALYLLPTVILLARGVPDAGWVITFNVLLGWTGVFWFITLFVALFARGRGEPAEPASPPAPVVVLVLPSPAEGDGAEHRAARQAFRERWGVWPEDDVREEARP